MKTPACITQLGRMLLVQVLDSGLRVIIGAFGLKDPTVTRTEIGQLNLAHDLPAESEYMMFQPRHWPMASLGPTI